MSHGFMVFVFGTLGAIVVLFILSFILPELWGGNTGVWIHTGLLGVGYLVYKGLKDLY